MFLQTCLFGVVGISPSLFRESDMLRRYWFNLASSESPSILNIGCGITAYDEADARRILEEKVFSVYGAREVLSTIEDVDISTLEENHVRPNMGLPVIRGVWFPPLA